MVEGNEMGPLYAHKLAHMEGKVQSRLRCSTAAPNTGGGRDKTSLYRTKGHWTNEQRELESPTIKMGETDSKHGQDKL